MKVLFVNTLYAPQAQGGTEVILQSLAEGLKLRGVEPVILTTSGRRGLKVEEYGGIRIWRAGIRNLYWSYRESRPPLFARRVWHALDIYNPFMAAHVRRVIEHERPDIVQTHNLSSWSISAWVQCFKMGIPVTHVIHDQYLLCPTGTMFRNNDNCETQCTNCKISRMVHPKVSTRITAVVGVSHFVLDRHHKYGYFENVPIQKVIYNARPPQVKDMNQSPESSEDRTKEVIRFGFLGTLVKAKGIELLLKAFNGLENCGLNLELWVAGSGHSQYITSLKQLSTNPNVRFLGRVRPETFFPEVDALIVPSLWHDTLPGVVYEALAFGKPVIASRRGGIPEMVQHGTNGLLFEPNRPHELSDAIIKIASDNNIRNQLGGAAKISVKKFFDQARFLDEHIAVLKGALNYRFEKRMD